MYNLGITFTVYSDAMTIDRILPFDVIPRILSIEEWQHVESGIVQRLTAINLLLDDIYHQQHILRDCVIPAELILGNRNYRPLMHGIDLPHKTYVNICGTDIVRDEIGAFLAYPRRLQFGLFRVFFFGARNGRPARSRKNVPSMMPD